MLIMWMAYATLFSALVACGALAAERVVRTWRGAERAVWATALVVAIVVPALLAAYVPPPPSARRARAVAAAPSLLPFSADRVLPRFLTLVAPLEPYAARAWLAASGAVLLVLAGAQLSLRRRSSAWRAGELDGVPVLFAVDAGPAVIGAIHPRIVVPTWASSLDREQRALMLLHEGEHIRAHDARVLLAAVLSLVLSPWNLILWAIVRRLRLAIETDCDRRVLRLAAGTHAYGMLLLAVGAHGSAPLPFVTALVGRTSLLERRIRAMTATTPRHRLLVSLVPLAMIVLATAAAASTPRPHSLRRPAAPPATARRDSLPPITLTYQDAPIDKVIAAFAAFTGRTIRKTSSVTGTITAAVSRQPWDVALKSIMTQNGFTVTFNADDSITIDKK